MEILESGKLVIRKLEFELKKIPVRNGDHIVPTTQLSQVEHIVLHVTNFKSFYSQTILSTTSSLKKMTVYILATQKLSSLNITRHSASFPSTLVQINLHHQSPSYVSDAF